MSFLQYQGTISIPTISGKVISEDAILPSKESTVMDLTSVCSTQDDDCSVSSNEEESDRYHDSRGELGSFAASASPIDCIDEHGDLPFTHIPSLLPVVEEELEEDEEDINFLPDIPEKKAMKGEEETLATSSTAGSEFSRPMDSPSSITFEHEDDLVQSDQRGSNPNYEAERMKAMMIMKDVIFEQRSTIKRATKEKGLLHVKYSACKVEKRNLQKENKGMQKDMTKLTRRNEEMEEKIERLRAELDLAQMELGRRRPVSDRRRAVVEA